VLVWDKGGSRFMEVGSGETMLVRDGCGGWWFHGWWHVAVHDVGGCTTRCPVAFELSVDV